MGKRYSEDDEIYLEYYLFDDEENSYFAAAEFLERSNGQLIKKAHKMRKKNNAIGYVHKLYTPKEDDYIKKTYTMLSTKEMAEHLGRSRGAIEARARKLGIKKLKTLKNFDKEIRALAAQGCYKAQIARKLGLKPKSVGDYINRHNISCDRAPRKASSDNFRNDENIRHFTIKNKTWLK